MIDLATLNLATNTFDAQGGFSITNGIDPSAPAQFYLLELQ
jgi:hypothetical protein